MLERSHIETLNKSLSFYRRDKTVRINHGQVFLALFTECPKFHRHSGEHYFKHTFLLIKLINNMYLENCFTRGDVIFPVGKSGLTELEHVNPHLAKNDPQM